MERVDRTLAVTFSIDGIVGREIYEFRNELPGATQLLRATCLFEDALEALGEFDGYGFLGCLEDPRVELLSVEVA